MPITVSRLCRHPVKGLTPEDLDRVDLAVGEGMPGDRVYALALNSTHFDADHPRWLPKTSFLMLMRNERLAALETRYEDKTATLTVLRDGRPVARGSLRTAVGRAMVEEFFSAYMGGELSGRPRLVAAPSGHMFSDHQHRVLSIINLASVKDLERVVGQPIDPLRFRANVYIAGADPWAEREWVDRPITIGPVRLTVTSAIDRCAATNVKPGEGVRDMNIPRALARGYGVNECGVYARVDEGGTLAVGDALTVAAPAP